MILGAEDKPRSIRRRPQFALAVANAADRVLKDSGAKAVQKRVAVVGKTQILHEHACLGDSEMDKRLAKFIEEVKMFIFFTVGSIVVLEVLRSSCSPSADGQYEPKRAKLLLLGPLM